MAINTKVIKRRLKSIGSTKKITKAMEMISAVKMRRAVNNVLSSRSYADLAWKMLLDISQKTEIKHHLLLAKRRVKNIAVVFVTSNRGLSGGFSSRLIQEAHAYIVNAEKSDDVHVEIFLMGKRGRKIYKYYGHPVVAEFDKLDLTTRSEEILPLAQVVTSGYIERKYDKVVVAYTDFVSAIKQVPRVKQILPLKRADELLGHVGEDRENEKKENVEFTFEPSPIEVLNVLLPRLVEVQMYQAVLESDASEHSARMMAMRNASDAAEDMIKELNHNFNKARQAAITKEILDIVGGAAALG